MLLIDNGAGQEAKADMEYAKKRHRAIAGLRQTEKIASLR